MLHDKAGQSQLDKELERHLLKHRFLTGERCLIPSYLIKRAWVIEHSVFVETSMKTISIILDEYTAAGGDAAARFNLQIKITMFKMEPHVPPLFPYHLAVNLDEPWLEISCTRHSELFTALHKAWLQYVSPYFICGCLWKSKCMSFNMCICLVTACEDETCKSVHVWNCAVTVCVCLWVLYLWGYIHVCMHAKKTFSWRFCSH